MTIRRGNKRYVHFGVGIFLILGVLFFLNGSQKAQAAIANHLVINEVQTDSVSGAGGSYDDFVEIYNPSNQDIILDSWSLQKQSSASTSVIYKTSLNGTISAGGYFLIARGSVSTNQVLRDMADVLTASNFSISNGNVIYLVNDNLDIENQEDINIIDYLGMGNSESFEGVASAVNPPEEKSISRIPEGEDSDENSVDFIIRDTPSPQNSSAILVENSLGGAVLVTITPSEPTVQNIGPTRADIIFAVNSGGLARINYGLSADYGSTSPDAVIVANLETGINLEGLVCDTTYHYSVYAEDTTSDNHTTVDKIFATLPCGITLDSLIMTKESARANNEYSDGWAWDFNVTVWDLAETSLKMKFDQWSGVDNLEAGMNMQFSINGIDWIDISTNSTYSALGADTSMIDEDLASVGRQVNIQVRMKVPVGTLAGFYNSNYGILTE